MNTTINELVDHTETKIQMGDREKNRYKVGLKLLASFISENFLDIPLLPDDRFSKDGLFYIIPYIHRESVYENGNSYTLLVVYQIENGASHCPLRINFEPQDKNNFRLNVIDQFPARNIYKSLILREDGEFTTQIPDYATVTLSTLLSGDC